MFVKISELLKQNTRLTSDEREGEEGGVSVSIPANSDRSNGIRGTFRGIILPKMSFNPVSPLATKWKPSN